MPCEGVMTVSSRITTASPSPSGIDQGHVVPPSAIKQIRLHSFGAQPWQAERPEFFNHYPVYLRLQAMLLKLQRELEL